MKHIVINQLGIKPWGIEIPTKMMNYITFTSNDIFKYRISCEPFGKDGLSKRMRVQLTTLNLIDDWDRFFIRIVIYDIQGRKEAKRIETQYITAYKEKHGRRPRGNLID